MAKQIEEALKEAVEQIEEETPVSARVKQLLAKKKNLKRNKHNPLRPRRK
jgi:tartrate dehydratase alpha subunit/fumarate hydratase class I-like protein